MPHTKDQLPDALYRAAQVRALDARLIAAGTPLSEAALADLVDGFGLAEHLHKPLYMLSAGSRRKLGLLGPVITGDDGAHRIPFEVELWPPQRAGR